MRTRPVSHPLICFVVLSRRSRDGQPQRGSQTYKRRPERPVHPPIVFSPLPLSSGRDVPHRPTLRFIVEPDDLATMERP